MKRIMVSVTDVTKPSAPGRQHTFSISSDSDEEIEVGLTEWVRSKIQDVLEGEAAERSMQTHDDGEPSTP